MTLTEFINKKPHELRLGQWFYICFIARRLPRPRMQETTQKLYYTRSPALAVGLIHQIMVYYQWKELPEYD